MKMILNEILQKIGLIKRDVQGSDTRFSFQKDAVSRVTADVLEAENGRVKKLIVIPTGGGKTWVGLQIINELINKKYINKNKKVLWAVHTKYLKTQTNNSMSHEKHSGLREKFKFHPSIQDFIKVGTIREIERIFSSKERENYGLLVIDEAHHSAANSYARFFEFHMPIIGLTATPTRLDGKELPFDGISYSIKFSDLEKAGVIKMPEVNNLETNIDILADDISNKPGNKTLEQFNTPERNKYIAEWIFKNQKGYGFKKMIVFTGSKLHAKSLRKEISNLNDFNGQPFEEVGYVLGDENSSEANLSNDEYLEEQKNKERSIIVNCGVLTEGYDDPSIDTVIMATPSNSTVYYMQCMGRVVRVAEGNLSKNLYLFEFVDRLPNIKYRVDNRWLFNDISQELQPKVYDVEELDSPEEMNQRIQELLDKYNVRDGVQYENQSGEFGLLIFNDDKPEKDTEWVALPLEFGEGGNRYLECFNELCASIDNYVHYDDWESAVDSGFIIHEMLGIPVDDKFFSKKRIKDTFINSIARSKMLLNKRIDNDCIMYYKFIIKPTKLTLWQQFLRLIKK